MYHPARLYPALWGMEKTLRRALSRKGLGSPLPAGVRPAPRVRERSRRRNMKKNFEGKGRPQGQGQGEGVAFCASRNYISLFSALWRHCGT